MAEAQNKSRWLVVLLSLVPVWLAVSAGTAVWWSINKDDKKEEERQQRFAMEMSEERIAEDLRKLSQMVGERHTRDETTQYNLTRAAAMVAGVLGPSNTGYEIENIVAPDQWPIMRASLPGPEENSPHLWVVVPYDSPRDSETGLADSGLAAVIATAQALAKDQPQSHIHFLFVPHGNETESPVSETLKRVQALMSAPSAVFVIGPMGTSPQLVVLTPNAAEASARALGNLGSQEWLDYNLKNLATTYQPLNLPVLWVTTSRTGNASNTISARDIAVSAGKLVEWLRRAARLQASE